MKHGISPITDLSFANHELKSTFGLKIQSFGSKNTADIATFCANEYALSGNMLFKRVFKYHRCRK
jgi:hypothetical protein